jgi:hypothetical protein
MRVLVLEELGCKIWFTDKEVKFICVYSRNW